MESATTGAEGSSTVITRRPFFKVVSLKSTRTLRGPCAWAERTASAQTNSGDKNFETRLIKSNSFCVDDVSVEGFLTTTTAYSDCMPWIGQCQASRAIHRLHRKEQRQPAGTTSSNPGHCLLVFASFCVICGWLWPTACGFLPSKVLDCIIVATECHEKYKAHLRQCYGRFRRADAGPLSKVAAAGASTSRQSL